MSLLQIGRLNHGGEHEVRNSTFEFYSVPTYDAGAPPLPHPEEIGSLLQYNSSCSRHG